MIAQTRMVTEVERIENLKWRQTDKHKATSNV